MNFGGKVIAVTLAHAMLEASSKERSKARLLSSGACLLVKNAGAND